MSGQGTQALLSLIERDWDTFVESAAYAWLGWEIGDQGALAADWFRTATTPAVAQATLRAASAIDVSAEAATGRHPALRDQPVRSRPPRRRTPGSLGGFGPRRDRGPGGEERQELIGRNRPGEEESLAQLAPEAAQPLQLVGRFDPLGRD
jgi:hypothetical protein